jgi:hypothetical protein
MYDVDAISGYSLAIGSASFFLTRKSCVIQKLKRSERCQRYLAMISLHLPRADYHCSNDHPKPNTVMPAAIKPDCLTSDIPPFHLCIYASFADPLHFCLQTGDEL